MKNDRFYFERRYIARLNGNDKLLKIITKTKFMKCDPTVRKHKFFLNYEKIQFKRTNSIVPTERKEFPSRDSNPQHFTCIINAIPFELPELTTSGPI